MAVKVFKGSVRPDVANVGAFASSIIYAAGYQCSCEFSGSHFGQRCRNKMGDYVRGAKIEIGIQPKVGREPTGKKEDWMAVCDPCHKGCRPR